MSLPIVDVCRASKIPGQGYVMARGAHEPIEASRPFPITTMFDEWGERTDDPSEALIVVFGSDVFGWCTFRLEPSTETVQ